MIKIRDKLSKYSLVAQGCAATGLLLADALIAREKLYRNHDFRLIHVKKTEDGLLSMRIVSPSSNRAVRKQLKRGDFYALSHLWGPKDQWVSWTSHGIAGDDGKPIEVMVRPEKQETMLALLEARPGFWWIDLFCAQSDTPLVIMGDIYRLCRHCYALIDFPEGEFKRIRVLGERLEVFISEDDSRLPDGYKEHIADKHHETDGSWREAYTDLLGWWYDGDPDDIKALENFSDCQWFKRVWTLQEYILPNVLTFMSENGSPGISLNRIHVANITYTFACAMEDTLESYLNKEFGDRFAIYGYHFGLSPDRMYYITNTPGASRCYQDLTQISAAYYCFPCIFSENIDHDNNEADNDTYLLGFENASIRALKLRYMSSKLDLTGVDLGRFAKIPRVCMDPRDYVYGVAGLLDIDIPREDDHRQVWASFRKIIQKRTPDVTIPKEFDLSSAESMQDVYKFIIQKNPEQNIDRVQKLHCLMDAVFPDEPT